MNLSHTTAVARLVLLIVVVVVGGSSLQRIWQWWWHHLAGDGRIAADAAPRGAVRTVREAARAGVLEAGGVRAVAERVPRQPCCAMVHQAHDPTVRHSVTPFSNLTREEFEARLTGITANGDDV